MATLLAERAVTQLEALVAGLLFVSESDHPWMVVRFALPAELDAPGLLRALGKPADSRVEQRSLEDFFARAVEDQAWYGPTERATAQRYRKLVGFLGSSLANTSVFRVGAIEIEAYVLGKTADGEWLGVATKQIET